MLVVQLCPTLCDPMDCIAHQILLSMILQARILEWVAIPFSRGSSWPSDWTWVSCITGRFFTIWAIKKSHRKTFIPCNNIKTHAWCLILSVVNMLHLLSNTLSKWTLGCASRSHWFLVTCQCPHCEWTQESSGCLLSLAEESVWQWLPAIRETPKCFIDRYLVCAWDGRWGWGTLGHQKGNPRLRVLKTRHYIHFSTMALGVPWPRCYARH